MQEMQWKNTSAFPSTQMSLCIETCQWDLFYKTDANASGSIIKNSRVNSPSDASVVLLYSLLHKNISDYNCRQNTQPSFSIFWRGDKKFD